MKLMTIDAFTIKTTLMSMTLAIVIRRKALQQIAIDLVVIVDVVAATEIGNVIGEIVSQIGIGITGRRLHRRLTTTVITISSKSITMKEENVIGREAGRGHRALPERARLSAICGVNETGIVIDPAASFVSTRPGRECCRCRRTDATGGSCSAMHSLSILAVCC